VHLHLQMFPYGQRFISDGAQVQLVHRRAAAERDAAVQSQLQVLADRRAAAAGAATVARAQRRASALAARWVCGTIMPCFLAARLRRATRRPVACKCAGHTHGSFACVVPAYNGINAPIGLTTRKWCSAQGFVCDVGTDCHCRQEAGDAAVSAAAAVQQRRRSLLASQAAAMAAARAEVASQRLADQR
jgi:hypothetical protein